MKTVNKAHRYTFDADKTYRLFDELSEDIQIANYDNAWFISHEPLGIEVNDIKFYEAVVLFWMEYLEKTK